MTQLAGSIEAALREAAEWRLLGLLFECPSAEWRASIAGLAADVRDEDLRLAARLAIAEATEGLYHSTFGPGGPAPPREATHRDMVQLGYLIAELEAYYAAFAYPRNHPEAPDHVSVEAGFAAYLKFKEAYAESCEDREAAEAAREACREFVAEHLASLAEPMTAALAGSGIPYLEAAARVLARRAGPAKPRFVVLEPAEAAADVLTCGAAAEPAEEEIV